MRSVLVTGRKGIVLCGCALFPNHGYKMPRGIPPGVVEGDKCLDALLRISDVMRRGDVHEDDSGGTDAGRSEMHGYLHPARQLEHPWTDQTKVAMWRMGAAVHRATHHSVVHQFPPDTRETRRTILNHL